MNASIEQETQINIAAFPECLGGRTVLVADGKEVHACLGSRQHYQDWIKARIRKFDFEEGIDYLIRKAANQLPHQGGARTVTVDQYLISLDMAKELAMVERTELGKRVRRYFLECERRLIEQALCLNDEEEDDPLEVVDPETLAIDLNTADLSAINRQASADVAGKHAQRFHRRREALLREQRRVRWMTSLAIHRPVWAR